MPQVDFDNALEPLLARDPRYARAAYHFVREGLDHTQAVLKQRGITFPRAEIDNHITATELLDGLRELALQQFGPMALCVLEDWGIRSCEDFGEIVFNLVEQRILSKTEHDRREDFRSGYDFAEAFRLPFAPTSRSN